MQLAEARDNQHRAEEEARKFNQMKSIGLGVATAAAACVAGAALIVEHTGILTVGAAAVVASGIGSLVVNKFLIGFIISLRSMRHFCFIYFYFLLQHCRVN